MCDVAISVEGLGKRYQIGRKSDPYGRLTESLWRGLLAPIDMARGKHRETGDWIWALRDVSFELRSGDVTGVVGSNGSGKSTLLKILSRITEPTAGTVMLRGRVASLLEVGTGFHPELTGRENIFLSGAVLGMRRADINRRFDEIVDFAGTEQFLDTPVKRYSSGMQVRLGFAVAAHLETEILLVDEVLAVGDAEFQKKCLGKMSDVARGGRTILFVSHNMHAVSALCDRAILLKQGLVAFEGPVEQVVRAYADQSTAQPVADTGAFVFPAASEKVAQIERVRLLDDQGQVSRYHDLSRPIDVVIDFVAREDLTGLLAGCEVHSSDGDLVYVTLDPDWVNYSSAKKSDRSPASAGRYQATIHMPAPLLNSGVYELVIYLSQGGEYLDWQRGVNLEIVDPGSFASVVFKRPRSGVVAIPIRWDIRRRPAPQADAAASPTVSARAPHR
jgi:lipopolysaccharide transport system ATP-binding protein